MNGYEILHEHLKPAGLTVGKREWYALEDGTFSFHGTIESLQGEKLTRIQVASHTEFKAREDSPQKVMAGLFQIVTSEKIWVGNYNDYHSVIEWKDGGFVTRELTKKEKLEHNGVY